MYRRETKAPAFHYFFFMNEKGIMILDHNLARCCAELLADVEESTIQQFCRDLQADRPGHMATCPIYRCHWCGRKVLFEAAPNFLLKFADLLDDVETTNTAIQALADQIHSYTKKV